MKMAQKVKVAIIGSGAAGIAATTRLLENGMNDLIILEAENRIGGRIYSKEFCGNVVDLGAQWCHGEKDNIVYDLAKDLDVLASSFNNYMDNTYYYSSGKVIDKSLTDRIYNMAFDIYDDDGLADFDGSSGDFFVTRYKEKVAENFGTNREIQAICNDMLNWFHLFMVSLDSAKTWFDISYQGAREYKCCEGDLLLQWKHRGFKTILDILMKKYPDPSKQLSVEDKILLNKEVTQIEWDNHSSELHPVKICCKDGTEYCADHVLVTVSLGVLKKHHDKLFQPKLPPVKVNAIEALGFGTVHKILLKFPSKWWPSDCKGFSLVWSEHDIHNIDKRFSGCSPEAGKSWLQYVYGFYPINSHPTVLLCWVAGEMAGEVENLAENVVLDGCMYLLDKFVGSSYTIERPEEILRSKWFTNPHFLGTYSYASLEAHRRKAKSTDLAEPVMSKNNKEVLLFAGEATHPCYFSTVHGAIESGFREADRILDHYK